MRAADLLSITPAGLYCSPGRFYIDPVSAVDSAIITHGHSDHARPGHAHVLATRETIAIMQLRMGAGCAASTQVLPYGERIRIGDVDVTLHPAGHVLGSAQVLLEANGLRVVVSGDYKRAHDPTCPPFETMRCDAFITEATFGLPVFRHPVAAGEVAKLLRSISLFPDRAHLVGAYALGKAQRVMALLREAGWERPIYIHGALEKMTGFYADEGVNLGEIIRIGAGENGRAAKKSGKYAGEIIICPPSAMADVWARKFADPLICFASGWMRVRARARQRGVELPLVVSDHGDWDELCATIIETGCSEVWVTHGAEDALVHWARQRGLSARPLHMMGYGEEGEDAALEGKLNETSFT